MILQLDIFTILIGLLLIIVTGYIFYKRKKMMYTKVIDNEGTRVCSMNPENKIHVLDNNLTVVDQLIKNYDNYPNKDFVGHHSKPTDPFSWITFKEFIENVRLVGSGIFKILENEEHNTFVGIFGKTCYEWILSQYGLAFYSKITCPLYDTLGKDAMKYIINHVNLSCCICYDLTLVEKILSLKDSSRIKYYILMKETDLQEIKSKNSDKQFFNLQDIMDIGKKNVIEFKKPTINDTFMLNFTSGSTGNPKGVIITHAMVMTTISSVYRLKNFTIFPYFTDEDVYFSFLPLAHILEQMMMCICIYSQASIGFYAGEITKLVDDIETLKPTVVVLVPRILIRIYNMTKEKIAGSKIKLMLFQSAIKMGQSLINLGLSADMFSKTMFKQLKNKFGGRVRIVISGSAPCPIEVTQFIRIALGVTFHNGYGLSETCGPVTLTFRNDHDNASVGPPICCTSVRLKDVPDQDIIVKRDKTGEICVKGPSCSKGYYKDEENTKALFDEDGWLRTGDVGKWDDKGRLVIVDRVKNLFKTSHGEYVSPEKLENVYATVPIIEQIVIDGHESRVIALIYPSRINLEKLVSKEVLDMDFNNSDELKKLFKVKCDEKAELMGFNGIEKLDLIYFMKEPIVSNDSGLMTPTMKYVRRKIREHFKNEYRLTYERAMAKK